MPEDVHITLAWPRRRRAGVALHISSLPGAFGIGGPGPEAEAFVDDLVRMGLGVWQFLPLGPTGYGDSPYQPLSAFAGNEMLVAMEPLIRDGFLTDNEVAPLRDLPAGYVDHARLIPLKAAILGRAADRFEVRANAALRAEYDAFLEMHEDDWLGDYVLFRVLKTRHAERPWYEWETRCARRDPKALKAARERDRSACEHYRIIQFLFHRQWSDLRTYAAERGVRMFGDIPIYIAWDSVDAWSHPEMLLLDEAGRPERVAGVPPDYFSEDGQLWGNPLYDWRHHAAQGFRWWIERLRHAVGLADLVRIDHFRGFESYWSVPRDAASARAGEWRPGPGDALLLAAKATLGELPIVAEDLGVITPEVEALRRRHGIPGMKVLQFALVDPDFTVDEIEEQCVCYTGTHDNDTTVGWFASGPDELRTEDEIHRTRMRVLELTGGSSESVHDDLVRLAFSSRARVAIAPMQDYLGLGSEARYNLPGRLHGNWRWRLPEAALSPPLLEKIAEYSAAAGRV